MLTPAITTMVAAAATEVVSDCGSQCCEKMREDDLFFQSHHETVTWGQKRHQTKFET